jgi:Lysylphosphatidylglycerol synthase TM region
VLLNKNIKLILKYFLGPLVFLFLSYSIYRQLLKQPNWLGSLQQISQAITGPQRWKIWLVVILMPVNWGLEAKKWQLSIRQIQPISFWRAFKATLTGITMASFTPNRIGEYVGRILYVEEGKRIQSISLTIVCSMAQLLITTLAGCLGVFYLKWYLHQQIPASGQAWQSLFSVILSGAGVFTVVLITFFFRIAWIVKISEKMPSLNKFLKYVKVLEDFNTTILLRILFLSFGRYLVFILQYSLLFSVFGVLMTWDQTLSGISVMFLVMAIVPSFTFLTELGLRWEASIQILEFFSFNTIGIFAASLGIWIVN